MKKTLLEKTMEQVLNNLAAKDEKELNKYGYPRLPVKVENKK